MVVLQVGIMSFAITFHSVSGCRWIWIWIWIVAARGVSRVVVVFGIVHVDIVVIHNR